MNTDWNFVADTIRRRKCVLFIGPQVYADAAGVSLDEALCNMLDARNPDNPYIRAFYEQDNFFLFRENKFKSRVISQIRQFYSQPFPHVETTLEKIARIPFQIVVSLTPDRLFSNILTKYGVNHQCNFYHYGQSARPLEKPVQDLPLFYNLLGWTEEDESLILTHNDFFSYLEAVFAGGKMQMDLKSELLQANNYIFLGMPYGKWYMQLLLRVLNLHVDGANFERISPVPAALDVSTRTMYEQQFKIQFVDEQVDKFIDDLYDNCEKQGLLRKIDTANTMSAPDSAVNLDTIVDLVAYGETKKALESLRGLLGPLRVVKSALREHETSVILLLSRFEVLDRKSLVGAVYSQEDHVERAKINYDLLEIINKIRDVL